MELITEKYRPKTVDELVAPTSNDINLIDKIKKWKENNMIDNHLLFFGIQGTGKSSTVKVILKELDITDYKIINGSDKTGIEDMRNIIEYASVPPFDGFKVVVIEEFERLSAQAQDSLKYVMEQYSFWCRFILTTNNITKVTAPIISRCEVYKFNELDKQGFVNKIINILSNENIEFAVNDVIAYIDNTYPDLRHCLNTINKNTIETNGHLQLKSFNLDDDKFGDKFEKILKHWIQTHNHLDVRKFMSENFTDNDYELMYRFMYLNTNLITTDVQKWDVIFSKIAEYLYRNPTVAYKDLNLMACLCDIKLSIQ